MIPWEWIGLLVLSYLVGAIPFGLVIGRLVGGIDIREYGSGNIGATNVLRTLGRGPSAVVFACDFGKAVVIVLMARAVVGEPALEVACGAMAVLGHTWSPYLGMRGGKGVASGFGGLVALSPVAAAIVFVFGAAVMVVSRVVSLGSILSSVFAVVVVTALSAWFHQPVEHVAYAVVAMMLIVYRHRENIARLRSGVEPRIGQKAAERRFRAGG